MRQPTTGRRTGAQYADAAGDNPAQEFRRQLIADAVRRQGSPAQVLDIGSGQGDLLASLRAAWPEAELAGLELSAEGIRRAAAKVPGARFWQIDLLAKHRGAPEIIGLGRGRDLQRSPRTRR